MQFQATQSIPNNFQRKIDDVFITAQISLTLLKRNPIIVSYNLVVNNVKLFTNYIGTS